MPLNEIHFAGLEELFWLEMYSLFYTKYNNSWNQFIFISINKSYKHSHVMMSLLSEPQGINFLFQVIIVAKWQLLN